MFFPFLTMTKIYESKNGSSKANISTILSLMNGIESIIEPDDIIVIKPNGQWWNQGMTNTDDLSGLIEAIINMGRFRGEIIIAENHHFPTDDSRAWTTEEKNGSFNLNELVQYWNEKGHPNISKYHWHDGGPSRQPSWGGAENGGVVDGPWQGDGYVWCKDLEYIAPNGRKTLMNYPIFTSAHSGKTIDFKNGLWENGQYINSPIKFINFSGLNYHDQTGVTGAIKNYLGITDMTCGRRGLEPIGYDNFHHVGFSRLPKWYKLIKYACGWKDWGNYIGGAVGRFMKTIRKADINFISATWIGWGDRIDPSRGVRANTILASQDPVALDYYAAKYVLLPHGRRLDHSGHYTQFHDPDNQQKPFYTFLKSCEAEGAGMMDEGKFEVISHDFKQNN